jgi:hypothetical protein
MNARPLCLVEHHPSDDLLNRLIVDRNHDMLTGLPAELPQERPEVCVIGLRREGDRVRRG